MNSINSSWSRSASAEELWCATFRGTVGIVVSYNSEEDPDALADAPPAPQPPEGLRRPQQPVLRLRRPPPPARLLPAAGRRPRRYRAARGGGARRGYRPGRPPRRARQAPAGPDPDRRGPVRRHGRGGQPQRRPDRGTRRRRDPAAVPGRFVRRGRLVAEPAPLGR